MTFSELLQQLSVTFPALLEWLSESIIVKYIMEIHGI